MRPFSENAQCMKCGWKVVDALWFQGVEPEPEHMLRCCDRCGFHWHEAPLNLLVPTEPKYWMPPDPMKPGWLP
jgi:hypothetical protein